MVKKILITILIVPLVFSLLLLGCKVSTSAKVSDEIQNVEEIGPPDAPQESSRSAAEMYEKSMEPKQLEILVGDSHGTFIFEEEPDNAEKLKEIVLFFLH